jgi:hypothetical protein
MQISTLRQPVTYTQVSMAETQTKPDIDLPLHIHDGLPTPISPGRSFFSMDGILMSCIIPPLMGFGFVALGLYIIYGNSTLVVSKSTDNAAVISQAVTALFAVWHVVALIPAFSMVQRVRSEEWWRRLLKGTYFNRANSVSSNISGTYGHTFEMVVSWSSRYFKLAWITAIVAVILTDIAPGAIRIQIGLNAIPSLFPVPAIPANSIYSNYSKPFLYSGDLIHASRDIAPIYYKAFTYGGTYVKTAPPAFNALVPRPNITPGQGYRYSTDVYVQFPRYGWKRRSHGYSIAGYS